MSWRGTWLEPVAYFDLADSDWGQVIAEVVAQHNVLRSRDAVALSGIS